MGRPHHKNGIAHDIAHRASNIGAVAEHAASAWSTMTAVLSVQP